MQMWFLKVMQCTYFKECMYTYWCFILDAEMCMWNVSNAEYRILLMQLEDTLNNQYVFITLPLFLDVYVNVVSILLGIHKLFYGFECEVCVFWLKWSFKLDVRLYTQSIFLFNVSIQSRLNLLQKVRFSTSWLTKRK